MAAGLLDAENILNNLECEQQQQVEEQVEEMEEEEVVCPPEEMQQTNEQMVEPEPVQPATPAVYIRSKQLYVGNISYGSNEDSLKEYFGKFGEISKFVLSKTKKQLDGSQGHRGFAFLSFVDAGVSEQVVSQAHNVDNRELVVNEAKPKTTKFFVGGINKEKTNEQSLRDYFGSMGEITDCFCVVSRGFGFVTMVDDGENVNRILEEGKHEIDGQMCDVKPAKKKEEMGGGRGRGRGGRGRGGRGRSYGQQFNPYQQQNQGYGGYQQQQNAYGQPAQSWGQMGAWGQQNQGYGQQY